MSGPVSLPPGAGLKGGSLHDLLRLDDGRIRRRVVIPADMSQTERADLSRRLYEVHRMIFSGISEEHFFSHVVDPPAASTVIQLYIAPDEAIVGYCAIHRFRRRIRGRSVLVLRAEAGLLPSYRGRGATYGFGMIRAALEKALHPFTPVYYLGTLVHMSSYHLFCKYFPRLFPQPFAETSEDMETIARELIDSFPDPPVAPDDPFVRDVGWVTIETPQEQALDRHFRDVEYFLTRNPGYAKGHGLVVVVPMTFGNIIKALAIRATERVRRVYQSNL